MNDSLFVEGIRNQDPAAAQHLTECYLPTVWRFVYFRVGGDRHLAEDIVSEAVIALLRAVANDVEIKSPAAWLRSVANHKVQDHFRAAARVQHLIDQVKQTRATPEVDDAAQQMEDSERRAMIREVFDDLPERTRHVLEWKYIDRVSVREIASRLATTEKSAESILFRARREFRRQLQQREEPDGPPGGTGSNSRQSRPAGEMRVVDSGDDNSSGSGSRATDLTR